MAHLPAPSLRASTGPSRRHPRRPGGGLVLSGLVAGLLGSGLVGLGGDPAQAQDTPVPFASVRALNLARNTAVRLNGGLGIYHPAACMFNTDAGGGSCLVRRDGQGYLYRFDGGAPGWQQLGLKASTETEILVAPDGRAVTQVLYNGAPR